MSPNDNLVCCFTVLLSYTVVHRFYCLFEFDWEEVGVGLLTFSAFRMGAYLRWVLIRGWALIRKNTVC